MALFLFSSFIIDVVIVDCDSYFVLLLCCYFLSSSDIFIVSFWSCFMLCTQYIFVFSCLVYIFGVQCSVFVSRFHTPTIWMVHSWLSTSLCTIFNNRNTNSLRQFGNHVKSIRKYYSVNGEILLRLSAIFYRFCWYYNCCLLVLWFSELVICCSIIGSAYRTLAISMISV